MKARKQGSKQASKQASKQVSMQGNKQASKQTSKYILPSKSLYIILHKTFDNCCIKIKGNIKK